MAHDRMMLLGRRGWARRGREEEEGCSGRGGVQPKGKSGLCTRAGVAEVVGDVGIECGGECGTVSALSSLQKLRNPGTWCQPPTPPHPCHSRILSPLALPIPHLPAHSSSTFPSSSSSHTMLNAKRSSPGLREHSCSHSSRGSMGMTRCTRYLGPQDVTCRIFWGGDGSPGRG